MKLRIFLRLHNDDDQVGFQEFKSVLLAHGANSRQDATEFSRTVVNIFEAIDVDRSGSISATELDRALSILETHGHDSPADKLKKHWCACVRVCAPVPFLARCVCVCARV